MWASVLVHSRAAVAFTLEFCVCLCVYAVANVDVSMVVNIYSIQPTAHTHT